jgi:hypothetical protein
MLRAKSIIRVAAWPESGALYAGQVRTINIPIRDGSARIVVEEMITQGGQGNDPLRGDPLTRWRRHPGLGQKFAFMEHAIASDASFPLAFPFLVALTARSSRERIGATGAGTWYERPDGLFELWAFPSVGNPPTVAGGYEREFVLYHFLSDNRSDWWSVDYNRNTTNLALRRAALRLTNDIIPADHYPSAHGISGGGAFITEEAERVSTGRLSDTKLSRVLYLMLKTFYGEGSQKNILARKYVDIRGSEFELWMAKWDEHGAPVWQEAADGIVPPELITHGYAPHPWPIDAIYETPHGWRGWPRYFSLTLGGQPFTDEPRFMAVTGQPADPQLALIFSPDMINWSTYLQIDLGKDWQGAEINYRTCDATGSGNFMFGSNRDAVDPSNPTGNMAQWELVLETVS